jgi:hypothetical protein
MKKLFTFLALVITLISSAQAPQGFNYQATVRNSSGALIVNQNVYFKFNVMLNSATSVPVYSETHYVPTDDLGQVNCTIGQGTDATGTFSTINWGKGNYYLGIELNTGAGYVAMGTTQLLSVPYALYANNAGSTTGNTAGLTHYVGELFGGGIVVSVWKISGVEHGLIASLEYLPQSVWTKAAFTSTMIGTTAQSTRDGLANTNAIVAQAGPVNDYAAVRCKSYRGGGFDDWYLPAMNELKLCYNSALIIKEVLGETRGFRDSTYWSSTEYNDVIAYTFSFVTGGFGAGNKSSSNEVLAVRRF